MSQPAKPKMRDEALRQPIIEAACRVFIEHGAGGATMQDIADEMGISRPALYYYFRNKEAILTALAEQVAAKAQALTSEAAQRDDLPADQALREIVVNYARLMAHNPLQFRVLDREEQLLDRLIPDHARDKRLILENIARVIRRGMEAGLFKPVDATVAALGIIGMCNWTTRWFSPDGRLSAGDIAGQYADLALDALRRPGGPRAAAPTLGEAVRLLAEDLRFVEIHAARLEKKGD